MVINLTVPSSWDELSQDQLAFLLETIVNVQKITEAERFLSAEDYSVQTLYAVATYCLFRWTDLEVLTPYGDGYLLKKGNIEFALSGEALAAALSALDWIREPPAQPVRLELVGDGHAVNADLSGMPFEDYLACENLWQGYNATRDDALLLQMAEILYQCPDLKAQEHELLGVFYWWAAVKTFFSARFPHFYQPSSGDGAAPDYDTLRRSVDAQIRALTKGDITKESRVLSLDCWRALTELDALAYEYEQLNRKFNNKSNG